MTFNFISFDFVNSISCLAKSRLINNTRGPIARSEPDERELQMKQLFLCGNTFQEIADQQNPKISRERVRQILKKRFGIIGKDGGKFLSTTPIKIANTINKEKSKIENKERKCQKIFGCTIEKFLELNGGECRFHENGTASLAYYQQFRNAVTRNIEWNITFPEWCEVWEKSGNYNNRGRGKGYCMARIGDSGGYEKDNVKIITISENFSESYLKWSKEHRYNKAIENGNLPFNFTKKEFCKNGHKLEGENLYITKKGRVCKVCRNIYMKKYYHAHKESEM